VTWPPGTIGPRYFGFIPHVDAAARTISFDRAELLTGKAAQRAAEEDGAVARGEPVPNDYYIRDPDKSTRVLKVWPGAHILGSVPVTLLRKNGPPKWCASNRCDSWGMGLDQFFAAWREKGSGAQGKYWITLRKGRVAKIEEQYTP
jgi:hypothetical protein